MPPRLLDESIYDRARHLATIQELLGEDLWFTKRRTKQGPVPRRRFADRHLVAAIKDGHHELAKRVMQAFVKYWPMSIATGRPLWNDYGVVKPWSTTISTVGEFSESGHRRTHVTASSVWLQHMFMRRSVLPSYGAEVSFDAVRLDIDVEIGNETHDLYRLEQRELVRVFAPWVDAIERLRQAVGHFEVEWMLSGYRGFWLSLFFDTGGTRDEALQIRDAIIRAVNGEHGERVGTPTVSVDDLTYSIDLGNLSIWPCRVPWSMHQCSDNISVNVDPRTGEPDVLQFVETPFNPLSLSDFADLLPACWSEPILPMTVEEFDRSAEGLVVAYREWLRSVDGRSGPTGAETGPRPTTHAQNAAADRAAAGSHARKTSGRSGSRGGVRVGWDDEAYPKRRGFATNPDGLQHLRWTWVDVIAEAHGERFPVDWREFVKRDAPDGEKRSTIVMGGNLMTVARAMKYLYHGRIEWDQIVAEYEAAYADADWSKGGTIRDWVRHLRRDTQDGATITPLLPCLSPEEVQWCREFAQTVPGVQRRHREDLFHLLLILRRLSVGRDEFEATEDFLARRAGINPFPTWEEQHAAEFDADDHRFLRADTGNPLPPRDYPSSVSARKRLSRLLRLICDVEEGRSAPSGSHPFWRRERGSNGRDHPRVISAGRPVGGLFRVVRSHPFWAGPVG